MPDAKDGKDIFYRNALYPDAAGLITWSPKSIQDVKDTAVVVIDTNALLVPYSTGKSSLGVIEEKYRGLANGKRLVVPGQVVREFASNRVGKLKELHQQLTQKLLKVSRGSYPLLDGIEEYKRMVECENELEKPLKDYASAVDAVLEKVRGWNWDDPVSSLYQRLFTPEVVYDHPFEQNEIRIELERRIAQKIPPGYKDAGKEDGGVGDLIIWRTILALGAERKSDLIFVSGDRKQDWWEQGDGRPLYPRFELVDEYRRAAEGRTLHLITFADFLKLFGASETVVEEVRSEEDDPRSSLSHAEAAVLEWLQRIHRNARIDFQAGLFNIVVTYREGDVFGYRVESTLDSVERALQDVVFHNLDNLRRLFIVFAAEDDREETAALRSISSWRLPSRTSVVIGHLERQPGRYLRLFIPDSEEPPQDRWRSSS